MLRTSYHWILLTTVLECPCRVFSTSYHWILLTTVFECPCRVLGTELQSGRRDIAERCRPEWLRTSCWSCGQPVLGAVGRRWRWTEVDIWPRRNGTTLRWWSSHRPLRPHIQDSDSLNLHNQPICDAISSTEKINNDTICNTGKKRILNISKLKVLVFCAKPIAKTSIFVHSLEMPVGANSQPSPSPWPVTF